MTFTDGKNKKQENFRSLLLNIVVEISAIASRMHVGCLRYVGHYWFRGKQI